MSESNSISTEIITLSVNFHSWQPPPPHIQTTSHAYHFSFVSVFYDFTQLGCQVRGNKLENQLSDCSMCPSLDDVIQHQSNRSSVYCLLQPVCSRSLFLINPMHFSSSLSASTSTRHVLNDQAKTPQATGDLTILLTAIQTTCKFIATNVRRARLLNLWVRKAFKIWASKLWSKWMKCDLRHSSLFCVSQKKNEKNRIGAAGVTNVQGEEQKKLDVLSNQIMINSLRASGKIALMVSEEDVSFCITDHTTWQERGRGTNQIITVPKMLKKVSEDFLNLRCSLLTSYFWDYDRETGWSDLRGRPQTTRKVLRSLWSARWQFEHWCGCQHWDNFWYLSGGEVLMLEQGGGWGVFGNDAISNCWCFRHFIVWYLSKPDGETPDIKHVLKPGKEMVAAGYCMYGSSANLVISTGKGVNGYTLDNVCLNLFGPFLYLQTFSSDKFSLF